MLNLKEIQAQTIAKEEVIKLSSIDGEVKIKELSVKENNEVHRLLFKNAQIKSKDDIKFDLANSIDALILKVHFGLVEPKMSVEQLNKLGSGAAEFLKEVAEAIDDLSAKK